MPGLYRQYFKRILDFIFALLIILIFSWLIVFLLLAFIVTMEFPIFFKSCRTGKDGKPFIMWKFRTLRTDSTLHLVERKFWFGNFLRMSNLDELPQLWNVLRGEMSLIGPRALPVEYDQLFSAEQRRRCEVKPGITGWAQVNGRHSISWKKKLELDKYYVNHISLGLDLRIFFKTIVLLLSFKQDMSLDEQPFKGN